MSEFEFLSVLVSIIIGLGMTHILSGMMRAIFRGRANEAQLVYSVFMVLVLVLNWWVVFNWRGHAAWSFDQFLLLVVWAISHYLIAITLFPPVRSRDIPFRESRRWFLWSFAVMVLLDVGQTAMRGDLFEPWFYLPFVLHYCVLAVIGVYTNNRVFHRLLSWWFLFVMLMWALGVRRFLVP